MLKDEARDKIEEAIMDAQITCEKFLEKPRQSSFNLLELSVQKMLKVLDEHSVDLKEDHKRDNYKLHSLVPLQTYYMQMALNDKNEEAKNEDK